MPILSIAAMEKILRKAGSERVSKRAAIELSKTLEEIGIEMGRDATELAKHAARKTVVDEDIRLARKKASS